MSDRRSRTVSVGLDVHAGSIRPSALRADELVDERTLPYDHEVVGRVIEQSPGARVCYYHARQVGPVCGGMFA
ncbi:MAG TPA: hypothetical protein VKV27_05660 [Solirubrobacteraceae bacterium]|nr:hypothetical protein [Solirubrobacteraceae bacterium]